MRRPEDQFEYYMSIARRIKDRRFTDLQAERAGSGFQAYIRDLAEPDHNCEHPNWSFNNGTVTVLPGATGVECREAQDYIEGKMSSRPYWNPFEEIAQKPERLYRYDIKILGKNGANPAVDPIWFRQMNRDGSVEVLSVCRHDGSLAFPGGFLEATVLKSTINETLEECYSDNLFTAGSLSAVRIDKLAQSPREARFAYMGIIRQVVEDELSGLGDLWTEEVEAYFQEEHSQVSPSLLITNIVQAIMSYNQAPIEFSPTDRIAVCAHLKCVLYEKLMPEEYDTFTKFYEGNMRKGEQCINGSDPRNSNRSWMVTTPMVCSTTHEQAEEMQSRCCLVASGGDDAKDCMFRSITEFAGEHGFSDHAGMMMEQLAFEIQMGRLTLTPALQRQIGDIASMYGVGVEEAAVSTILPFFYETDIVNESNNPESPVVGGQ